MNDSLLQQAEHASKLMQDINEALSTIEKSLDDDDESDGGQYDEPRQLSLLLNYRLDTQEALVALLQLDNGVLQALGIDSKHSSRVNIERMAFALGQDDLASILHALSQLVEQLLKAAYRVDAQSRLNAKTNQKNQTVQKESRFEKGLKKATKKQKAFILAIKELNKDLIMLTKHGPVGPVLDHVQAIKGPISQFFQAIQHGMAVSYKLYARINQSKAPNKQFTAVLSNVEQLLAQIPALNQSNHRLFKEPQAPSGNLEERAARKRTGHFFRY